MTAHAAAAAEGLVAGPEMDAEVARVVFGSAVQPQCTGYLQSRIWNDPLVHCDACGLEQPWNAPSLNGGRHYRARPYSTDLATAWTVVDKIIDGGGTEFHLTYGPVEYWPHEDTPKPVGERWRASCGIAGTDMCWRNAYAETPALAICRLGLVLNWSRALQGGAGPAAGEGE